MEVWELLHNFSANEDSIVFSHYGAVFDMGRKVDTGALKLYQSDGHLGGAENQHDPVQRRTVSIGEIGSGIPWTCDGHGQSYPHCLQPRCTRNTQTPEQVYLVGLVPELKN